MAVYTDVSFEELEGLLPATISARPCPSRASPRAWRIPISTCRPTAAPSSSPSMKSGCRPEDLPFFLGLMEHLAERGIACPLPVRDARRRQSWSCSTAARPPSSPSSTASRCAGPTPRIARRPARALAGLHAAGEGFRARPAPMRWGRRAGATLADAIHARADAVEDGPGRADRRRAGRIWRAHWPTRPAGGRDPCRSLPRQCAVHGRRGLRPDRFLFRLQRLLRL